MSGTWIRPARDPFSAAALRGEPDVLADDALLDFIDREEARIEEAWCPMCSYAIDAHVETADRDVTFWRCPSEAEAREAYGR